MKIISVSPYRAVVKVEASEESDSEEELEQRIPTGYGINEEIKPLTLQTPIRTDSEALRGQKEQYL